MQCYVKIYTRNNKDRNLGNNSNFGLLVELNGCFYHLCLTTWRHVHELGLTALYMVNDDVKRQVVSLFVRNFMPNPALAPLHTYFLQT